MYETNHFCNIATTKVIMSLYWLIYYQEDISKKEKNYQFSIIAL